MRVERKVDLRENDHIGPFIHWVQPTSFVSNLFISKFKGCLHIFISHFYTHFYNHTRSHTHTHTYTHIRFYTHIYNHTHTQRILIVIFISNLQSFSVSLYITIFFKPHISSLHIAPYSLASQAPAFAPLPFPPLHKLISQTLQFSIHLLSCTMMQLHIMRVFR